MLRASGDRTADLTLTLHKEILSQLGDGIEVTYMPGFGRLSGFIVPNSFKAKPTGKDASGTYMYWCEFVFQEKTQAS